MDDTPSGGGHFLELGACGPGRPVERRGVARYALTMPSFLIRRVGLVWVATVAALMGACSSSDDASVAGQDAGATPDGANTSDGGPSAEGGAGSDAGATNDAATDAPSGPGLAALSDDFGGATLSPGWSVLHPELVGVSVQGGALRLEATADSLWFNASQGPLVHKTVSGDFMITSRVRARSAATPAQPPAQTIHLGGLMARDPASASENFVFIVVGRDENDISVETKNTVASVSTYTGPTWPSGDAELRLCRVGSSFRMLKRDIAGGAWTDAATFDRPDMPATLQVGAVMYAHTQAPDLAVSFDEVTFAPVTSLGDCSS